MKETDSLKDNKTGLIKTEEGLIYKNADLMIKGDFERMLKRLTHANLSHELLIKACRIKNADHPLTVVDATAGLGEDALLLAAAGFNVELFERDEVIAALLKDTLERALKNEKLSFIVSRMHLHEEDSISGLKDIKTPDIIYLDPMFPARSKSSLVKKKFQVIHTLEAPCEDEDKLLLAALAAKPQRIIIKRPLKGAFLNGVKPSYSINGKTVRYDCIVP